MVDVTRYHRKRSGCNYYAAQQPGLSPTWAVLQPRMTNGTSASLFLLHRFVASLWLPTPEADISSSASHLHFNADPARR